MEAEVQRLKAQLSDMHELLRLHIQPNSGPLGDVTQGQVPGQQIPIPSPSHIMSDPGPMPTFLGTADPGGHHSRGPRCISTHRNGPLLQQLQTAEVNSPHPARQRRSGFDVREEPISDFISKGLMTIDQAMSCFTT